MTHPPRRNQVTAAARIAMTIATITGALAACAAGTTIEQSWSTQNRPAIQNAVTLVLMDSAVLRRAAEDEMARELAANGIQATPAYAVRGVAGLTDVAAVKSKLRALGYDSIVIMRIVDRETKLEDEPMTYNDWWSEAHHGFETPGHTSIESIVRIETSVYSLRTHELVWSALTRTVDPSTTDDLIDDTSKVVASQLTRRGMAT